MNDRFTLREIASWQLKAKESEVKLPLVQRGFVWKSQQVENLWDSILREYPIGSFLLQKTNDTYYLMDGQQRATSIFLGFFNPYISTDETKAWSIKGELPVIWIDICPVEKPDTSKFLIRLTTRSHPWGYQAKDNSKKLSVTDRHNALEIFRKNPESIRCGYTSFKNTTIFPYATCCPLPIAFFIDSETVEQIIEKTENYLPDNFCTKYGRFDNKQAFIEKLKSELYDHVAEVLTIVKKTFQKTVNYDIVADAVLREEETQANPTLFERINRSGTPLTNDDLIYSIYKMVFPISKELVEKTKSIRFIAPTQILSLASRLTWFEVNDYQYPQKMNVREFQRNIKDESFSNKLLKIIGTDGDSEIDNLFEEAIKILLFNGEIPLVLIKQFINKSQDLFLFFVCWLRIHGIPQDGNLHLKIAAKLWTFAWFSFGNVPKLWGEITDKEFWTKPLNQYFFENGTDGIHFLVPPELLKQYYKQEIIEKMFLENNDHRWGLWRNGIGNEIKNYYSRLKSQEFEWDTANNYFRSFIEKIRWNRQFILFAQRNYINSEFYDYNQIDDLEDTNVPWDWDHIYPSEWVYRKVYCNQSIKDWNNTNGNIRAIPLECNRSRGNQQSPNSISGEDERKYSFMLDNDWQYWQKIEDRIWDNKAENHYNAVTTRMINIYEKFWNDLKIDELIK